MGILIQVGHILHILQVINAAARLVRAHLDFSRHGVKHGDFCCFKGVVYVTLHCVVN